MSTLGKPRGRRGRYRYHQNVQLLKRMLLSGTLLNEKQNEADGRMYPPNNILQQQTRDPFVNPQNVYEDQYTNISQNTRPAYKPAYSEHPASHYASKGHASNSYAFRTPLPFAGEQYPRFPTSTTTDVIDTRAVNQIETCVRPNCCRSMYDDKPSYSFRVPTLSSHCCSNVPEPQGCPNQQPHAGVDFSQPCYRRNQDWYQYSDGVTSSHSVATASEGYYRKVQRNIPLNYPALGMDRAWPREVGHISDVNLQSTTSCYEYWNGNQGTSMENTCNQDNGLHKGAWTSRHYEEAPITVERNTCSPDCIDCCKVNAALIDRLQEMVDETEAFESKK